MSNIFSRKFVAVCATAVGALASGCASTGLPNYGSTDAGQRTANTTPTNKGIRVHGDGTPVEINYPACRELQAAIGATRPSNATQRAVNQSAGAIAGSIAGGNSGNVLNVLAGAAVGIFGSIAGDQANRAINGPHVARLEADCAQEKAYNEWNKAMGLCMRTYTNRTGGAAAAQETCKSTVPVRGVAAPATGSIPAPQQR